MKTRFGSRKFDRQASHEASLSLPVVKEAIPRGKALVASFERVAVTTAAWGVGLPRAHSWLRPGSRDPSSQRKGGDPVGFRLSLATRFELHPEQTSELPGVLRSKPGRFPSLNFAQEL